MLAEQVQEAAPPINRLLEKQYQIADQLISLVLLVEIKRIARVQKVGLLISHQANLLISQGPLLPKEVIRQADLPTVPKEVIRQVDLLATEVMRRADLLAVVVEVIHQADLVLVVQGVLLLEEKINSEKVIDIIIE